MSQYVVVVRLTARLFLTPDAAREALFDGLAPRERDRSTAEIPAHVSLPQWRVWRTDQRSPRWRDFLAAAHDLNEPFQPRFRVEFSNADVARASWSVWVATGHTGYPQPEESYLEETFGGTRACQTCNTGCIQTNPFRMRGEPRLGRRAIMQMFWVYDAWFVTPKAFEAVFEPFGIKAKAVLTKGGRNITSVVQLVIDETVPLAEYRTSGETCPSCGRFRLHAGLINYAPLPAREPTGPLVHSSQEYGSGGQSFRETLIRRDLVAAIEDAGLKGTRFHPCGDSSMRREFEESAGVVALFGPSPTCW